MDKTTGKSIGKTKKIISVTSMALILAVVLAANIVAGVMSSVITQYLFGWGAKVDGDDFIRAVSQSNELALEIAEEGIVMLKNENNALPLSSSDKKLNVFGWGATDGGFIISGSGSGETSGNKQTLLLDALSEEGYECNPEIIALNVGFQAKRQGSSLGSVANEFFRLYEPSYNAYNNLMANALAYSSTAVIVLSRLGGEDKDLPVVQYKKTTGNNYTTDSTRTYLQLSTEEEDMINLVTSSGFSKVILLLNTCNVMELGFVDDYDIDAVLSIGALGQVGAKAVGKIFNGKVNPSGKSVDIYAYDMKSDPTYVNAGVAGVTGYSGSGNYIDYNEGIYTGYKYYETAAFEKYINYDQTVQYPFGYGLSYTAFDWEVGDISPAKNAALKKDDKIEIEVIVTNTGAVAGRDVVQAYYTVPYTAGGIEKAYVKLGDFAKTALLGPGQSEVLTLSFDVYDMASYDCYDANNNGFKGFELEGGSYTIKLQNDSHTVNTCVDAQISYTVPAAGIRFDTDPVTGKSVVNRFTGTDAYGGVSIDGTTSNANIRYMTRANFAGTFPSAKAAARARGFTQAPSWYENTTLTDTMPTQGVDSGLRVATGDQLNEELVKQLGADFDHPNWELLLNQLTTAEMTALVIQGGYQTAAVPSIGKPRALDFDGPSGLNTGNSSIQQSHWTAFPVETVVASTWSKDLAYMMGLAVGNEAAQSKVSGWYAPAINIHRSPFGGRNFEYYSEDSYLSGVLGAEVVKGAMTNGLYCYLKHFIVNETETHRAGLYTWLTEQTLRESYLKPFEIAVKDGKANAVMSSFNYMGSLWTGGNKALLTDVLREEWGFRGSVVTDYADGVSTNWMNLNQGLRAGNDLWLTGVYPIGVYMDIDSNASGIASMRAGAKNILFTYINTYYVALTTEANDARFATKIGLKVAGDVFPYWIFAIIGLDVLALAGVGIWCYFLFIKPKRRAKLALAGGAPEGGAGSTEPPEGEEAGNDAPEDGTQG